MNESTIKLYLNEIKKELDSVSPSFCTAKWQQISLHLHNGLNHSCHHPAPHHIPLEEIQNDVSALHNTKYKKNVRKMMLEGQRPSECDYCWKVEDIGNLSDRVIKSSHSWGRPFINKISKLPWDSNINPSYLEVSFSNVCNLKCSYCGPNISSKWTEEIEKFGPYKLQDSFYNALSQKSIALKEDNPYIKAFWEWLPNIINDLEHFRITGGEPLLSKDTFKFLKYIYNNPKSNLNLSVNSNLCVPADIIDNFISQVLNIQNNKSVNKFQLFTSCEAFGNQAEYIRHGLNYNLWLQNLEKIIFSIPNCKVSITVTFNVLSISSFEYFLDDIHKLRTKHLGREIHLNIPYLRYPEFLSVWIMPLEWLEKIENIIKKMKNLKFHIIAIKNLEDIYEICKRTLHDKDKISHINNLRKKFVLFTNEHDLRRQTNFLNTFPEFNILYEQWNKNE